MQRHLALLAYLFPLPKRRPVEKESADVLLDRAKRLLQEAHTRNRERAVEAITAKNYLQSQVDDLQKTIQNLQKKSDEAVRRGNRELADRLLREKQGYEESLRSAEETLLHAVETAEQVKVAIKREEEWIRQAVEATEAFQVKWKDCAIQQEMQQQLERLGVWHLTQPPQPEIDRKTARELVGFLLVLVIAGLLIVITVLH